MDFRTCRICHRTTYDTPDAMIRVGPRHNIHWKCKLNGLPNREARVEWLRSLRPHQLAQAPALLLVNNGLYEFVSSVMEELKKEANQ